MHPRSLLRSAKFGRYRPIREAPQDVPVSVQHGRLLWVVRRGEVYGRPEVGDVVVHAGMLALKGLDRGYAVREAVVLDGMKALREERGRVYCEVADCDGPVGDALGVKGD